MSVFDWKGKPSQVKPAKPQSRVRRQGISHLTNVAVSVDQLDMEGNHIKRFPSIASAARCLGIGTDGVSQCLTGKRESFKGFKFKLAKFDKVQTKYEPERRSWGK